jgi:hypothetical protein
MVAAVVQHAADRELFVAGELAAANGPHKIGYLSRQECSLWVNNGHRGWLNECLLYPQKRTFVGISDFNEKEGF